MASLRHLLTRLVPSDVARCRVWPLIQSFDSFWQVKLGEEIIMCEMWVEYVGGKNFWDVFFICQEGLMMESLCFVCWCRTSVTFNLSKRFMIWLMIYQHKVDISYNVMLTIL